MHKNTYQPFKKGLTGAFVYFSEHVFQYDRFLSKAYIIGSAHGGLIAINWQYVVYGTYTVDIGGCDFHFWYNMSDSVIW